MDCPSCRDAMAPQALDARYGGRVDIDICHACAAFWFDGAESLALSPRAVLELCALFHEQRATVRRPFSGTPACPRCHARLIHTMDRQRNTRFAYWRCPTDHGRLITFVDFLREKNFVRPLDGREMGELRRNVQTMTCSSCGAPIDLMRDSVCSYCRAPFAMLDAKQVEKVITELHREDERRKLAVATLPGQLLADRARVESVFRAMGEPQWTDVTDSFGLFQGGLGAVAELVRGQLDAAASQ